MDTNFNIDYQDKIDSYILGEMNEAEMSVFEEELVSNKDLHEQYEFTLNVKQEISDRNKKIQLLEECQNRHNLKQINFRRKLYTTISGIAAVVVFGLFLINPNGNTPIIVMPEISSIEESTYRGNPDLQIISNLIIEKKYDLASKKIDSLEIALDEDIASLTRELSSEEEKQQIEYFKDLHKSLKDDLMWFRLHTLVGSGDNEKAIELLSVIRSSNNKYKERADSIYNTIK